MNEVKEMRDKFEEHMCPSRTEIFKRKDGKEDSFTFEPLGFEYMPKFFVLVKKFYSSLGKTDNQGLSEEEIEEKDIQKFFDSLDEDSLKLIKELIHAMCKESFPDEFKTPENQKKMSRFMARNIMTLMMVMMEMNSPYVESPQEPIKPNTFGGNNECNAESTKP